MHSPLPLPLTRDLVLAGGGHAHAIVLRVWGMNPLPGVRLTLVSPDPVAPYTGMLPGFVSGHYPRETLEIDLVRLARFAGARLVQDRVTGLDPDARRLALESGRSLRFDRLSLDIGVTAALPDLPGYADHATPARPLARIATRWDSYVRQVSRGDVRPQIVVIGAGVGGAELALAMQHRLHALPAPPATITLVDTSRALPGLTAATRRRLRAALSEARITVLENTPVTRVEPDGVVLGDGNRLPAQLVVGTPGATPQRWLAKTGMALTNGYVTVDDMLRSTSHSHIYAAGDCAHLSASPRPKAGVFAVRAGPILAHNLAADLSGGGRRVFRPQKDFLRLVGLGPKRALGQKGPLTFEGTTVWWLKDRIDRRFMDRLGPDLPQMPADSAPARAALGLREALAGPPLCTGCGGKVGLASLTRALGPGAALPEDAALLDGAPISTDHLRAMTGDEVLFARIAAHHAMSDIYAMGSTPRAALAHVILPPLAPALREDTLTNLLNAARATFAAAGAEIIGGHTTEGAELTLGFTVIGHATARPIRLGGAQPGDALILTKPIGIGTLLAGEMRRMARGRDVVTAFEAMCQPAAAAARILAGATAMTDVTGFGLAGHLVNLTRASGLGAVVEVSAVPLLPGALDLASAGLRSSLFAQNRSAVPELTGPDTPATALLFDPQTAGGLLAAVAADKAGETLCRLRDIGAVAAQIGTLQEGPGIVLSS